MAGWVPPAMSVEVMIRVPRRWVEGQVRKGKANIVNDNVMTAR